MSELSKNQLNSLVILSVLDYGKAISPLGIHFAAVLFSLANSGQPSAKVLETNRNIIGKHYSTFLSPLCDYNSGEHPADPDTSPQYQIINNISALVMGYNDFCHVSRKLGDVVVAARYDPDYRREWVKYKAKCDIRPDFPEDIIRKSISIVINITPILKYSLEKTNEMIFTDSHSKKISVKYLNCTMTTNIISCEKYKSVVLQIFGGKMILIGQSGQSGINVRAIANTPEMLMSISDEVIRAPTIAGDILFPQFSVKSSENISDLYKIWSHTLPESFKIPDSNKVNIDMTCVCRVGNITVDKKSRLPSILNEDTSQQKKNIIFDKPFCIVIRDKMGRTVFIGLCDQPDVSPEESTVCVPSSE